MIRIGRFDPMGAARPLLPFPEDGVRLETVHQIVGGFECGSAVRRGRAGEDDRFTGADFAAAVDHPHMREIEAAGRGLGNLVQGSAGQDWVILENQPLHPAMLGTSDTNETHDRPGTTCLIEEGTELARRFERRAFEACNDPHPPETGGRNSTWSTSPTRNSSETMAPSTHARTPPPVSAPAAAG